MAYDCSLAHAQAEIKRLRSELAKHQWRTMDSAPKDGTSVLLYLDWAGGFKEITVGRTVQAKMYLWDCGGTSVSATVLKRWMPLPEFPK